MTSCSIVIPTHNRPRLLTRAVESALLACPKNSEVLVIDDHSMPPAATSLEGINDKRLKIFINACNSGAAGARNYGVAMAKNNIIFFLDDDDEIVSDYCRRILGVQSANSHIDYGFSSIQIIDGKAAGSSHPSTTSVMQSGHSLPKFPLRRNIAALSAGFWIKRETFLEVGKLDVKQVIDEDTDLCCRLIGNEKVAWYEPSTGVTVYRNYIPDPGSAGRLTADTNNAIGLACYRRTYERNLQYFGQNFGAQWFLCARYLRRAAKAGGHKDARKFMRGIDGFLLRLLARPYFEMKMLSAIMKRTLFK